MFSTTKKIGILGGGQLGKMLCQAASSWDLKTYVLDKSADFPAGAVCTAFTEGNFNDYDDVMAFGRDKDILTIEIEHVHTGALHALQAAGVEVHPAPEALDIIKDKGLQKEFYRRHDLPTAAFALYDDENALRAAVAAGERLLPFVQKSRTAGYDGRGVALIRNREDLDAKLLPGPCLAEDLVPMQMEIAVIAARNTADEVTVFPAVEMDFHPEANLVEWLVCPARISPLVAAQAEALAERVIRAFGICGLLAVEMFLDEHGALLLNEVAPRPHNSGHHTIDTAETSQYQQHLRAICGMPLGDTRQLRPAVMINLLGEPGFTGPVYYQGVEDCLRIPGVHLHLYGKALTAPYRKMGHVTVGAESMDAALSNARKVKELLKVITQSKA